MSLMSSMHTGAFTRSHFNHMIILNDDDHYHTQAKTQADIEPHCSRADGNAVYQCFNKHEGW